MNARIFWVCVMECMCAQTRPHFILSSQSFLAMESEPMLLSREKIPCTRRLRAGLNLWCCITYNSKPNNTLLTKLEEEINWGFPTRMVYLKHDILWRYTILVGNPRNAPKSWHHSYSLSQRQTLTLDLISWILHPKQNKVHKSLLSVFNTQPTSTVISRWHTNTKVDLPYRIKGEY